MINKNQLQKSADGRISYAMSALKKDNNRMGLYCALLGIGQFRLELSPGAGHNYYSILEAIYRYYKTYPNSQIDKLLYETFLKFAQSTASLEGCAKYINIILAQLNNQKNNISPFTIDIKEVLLVLRESINQRNLINDPQFMTKVSEYDDYLYKNYGYKIL